ncbi:MAG: hypothetical protein E7536_07365 [Ruminococcaceae bacterium]|nr:hypothetical protein [Oscillospiraceae bacterium]
MKKLIALLMALTMVFAFVACGKDKEGDATTNPNAEPVVAETTVPSVTALPTEPSADEPEEPATEIVEVTNADGETITDASGEAVTETITQEATTKAPEKKPETKAEIVEYFNKAVNGVKTGAKSIKQLEVVNYLGGDAVIEGAIINGIYNGLGGNDWLDGMLQDNSQGEATYSTSADIKAKFPVENETWGSKLTVDDVESATCTEANGIYTITIKTKPDAKTTSIAHGEGHNPKVFSIALPETINANIPGVAQGIVGEAAMNYPSGTVVVQIDKGTGKVLSANYDAHWTINFDKMGVVLPLATKSAFIINW